MLASRSSIDRPDWQEIECRVWRLIGGTGRRKARFAFDIARARDSNGRCGRFFNFVDCMSKLDSKARAKRQRRIAELISWLDFLILDELRYLPSVKTGGELVFQLIGQLYESTSIIITIDRAFGE